MGLPIPVPGSDSGPDYAQNAGACWLTLDGHTHLQGSGSRITSLAININAALAFNNFDATSLRSTRYSSQPSVLTGASDLGCLSVVLNELFYNDLAGNRFALTSNGSIVGTNGSISGLVSPAAAAYNSGTQTVVFTSGATIAANVDIGFAVLRNSGAASLGLTLQAPTLTTNYSLTLPLPPASSNAIVVMSTTGVQTTVAVDSSTLTISGGTMQVPAGGITTTQIASSVALVPTGVMLPFGGPTANIPSGYLGCDGSSYLRASYTNLYSVIGSGYGSADSTHFNVPDMRGNFARGVDAGAGRDPDTTSRTAQNTGGNTGDAVGSVQAGQFASHNHYTATAAGYGSAGGYVADASGPTAYNTYTSSSGGNETRPINVYVNWIIKI
jgi:microcystin-dependent protein